MRHQMLVEASEKTVLSTMQNKPRINPVSREIAVNRSMSFEKWELMRD